jgi:hypothetical protein
VPAQQRPDGNLTSEQFKKLKIGTSHRFSAPPMGTLDDARSSGHEGIGMDREVQSASAFALRTPRNIPERVCLFQPEATETSRSISPSRFNLASDEHISEVRALS